MELIRSHPSEKMIPPHFFNLCLGLEHRLSVEVRLNVTGLDLYSLLFTN
jgi:hypothetical protein